MKRRLQAAGVAVLLAALAEGQTTGPVSAPAPVEKGPQARAILVSGSGGSQAYSRNLLDWSNRFCTVLTKQCGLKPANVVVLTEQADPGAGGLQTQTAASGASAPPRRQSTLANVKSAVEKMGATLGPQDQFILYLAGQGQINEPVGKLCLPGVDLKADELAAWLDGLPTRKTVLINCASGGAEFVKTCLKPGRVLITGAGVDSDGNQTYFAEFFLRGFESARADANKDGVIDLLEAYVYAAHETTNFYHRQYLVSANLRGKPGDPILFDVRGKETRDIWRRLYAGTENQLVPNPASRPGEPPRGDPEAEADAEPELGDYGPQWHNRRVLAEHARLDDTDGKKTFMLWRPYEFDPVPPDRSGQVGYVARRTALGRTEPLKVASPTTTSAASK